MKRLFILVAFCLIVSCSSEPIPEPQIAFSLPTVPPLLIATLEPTNNPVPPSPTPILSQADKIEAATIIKQGFDMPDNLLSVDSITWEGDLFKMKCTL
jgi:hypothetical protein